MSRDPVDVVEGPEKKSVYLRLPFYGDSVSTNVKKEVYKLLSCFPAVKPVIIFFTKRIPVASPKDRLPASASSNVIYKYVCNCGVSYIGRTRRRLSTRIREHVPGWIATGKKCKALTAVTKHIVSCSMSRDSDQRSNFSVVTRARSRVMLSVLEAMYIKELKPVLCCQKEFVMQLGLPW